MEVLLKDLRSLIQETLQDNEATRRANVLKPALLKLVQFLQQNPELISTEDGIEALNGTFYGIKAGQVPTEKNVQKELARFEKIAEKIYPGDNNEKMDLALTWAKSTETHKILVSFKHVREKLAKRPNDAPIEGKTWGKYLFSPARQDVPFEANTSEEDDAFHAIAKMLFKNKPIPMKVCQDIQRLISNGEYVEFFVPKARQFYRGLVNVPTSFLEQLLGFSPSESGETQVDKIFRPKGDSSSWSTLKDVAEGYAKSGAMSHHKTTKNNWSVVMYAHKKNNPKTFILNPEKLYEIGYFAGGESQDNASSFEVIGVGDVKLSYVKYWKPQ